MKTSHFDIVVMGCGPAGCASAIGLKRLGYSVAVIGQIRKHSVSEGISERVYQTLKSLELHHALTKVGEPAPRHVEWNGLNSAANTERLVERIAFDTALLDDLRHHQIPFIQETVLQHRDLGRDWEISTREHNHYRCKYLVEARGRAAPHGNCQFTRGPESLSLGQNWQSTDTNTPAFAKAVSTKDGWLWLAQRDSGQLFTQLSISTQRKDIPNKHQIHHFIKDALALHPQLTSLLDRYDPVGESLARGSTPILIDQPVNHRCIRIGDAAMSVDPLSGNGIFQSLSSALIAPAVINTLIQHPQDAELAQQFYRERIQHLFYRFGRIGRDFYQQEQRWLIAPFWNERSQWPDQQPAHHQGITTLRPALKPVVNEGFIEEQPVVVSEEHPLGIWRVGDQLAVDVLRQQQSSSN